MEGCDRRESEPGEVEVGKTGGEIGMNSRGWRGTEVKGREKGKEGGEQIMNLFYIKLIKKNEELGGGGGKFGEIIYIFVLITFLRSSVG